MHLRQLWKDIIFYCMKKEPNYLPNLASLLSQRQSYKNHIKRLHDSRSHYDASSVSALSCKKPSNQDHFLIKFIPEKQQGQAKSQDILRVNKSYRLELAPAQKRKYSDQPRQNLCINKVMQILSPSVDRYSKRGEGEGTVKERASRHRREGSKIAYKFKKSMLQVKRRKQQRVEYYTNRSNMVREEARAQLQAAIQKSIQMRHQEPRAQTIGIQNEAIVNSKTPRRVILQDSLAYPSHLKQRGSPEGVRLKTEDDSKEHFLTRHRQHINKQIPAYHLQGQNKKNTILPLDRPE